MSGKRCFNFGPTIFFLTGSLGGFSCRLGLDGKPSLLTIWIC